jgi:hypothetical protein
MSFAAKKERQGKNIQRQTQYDVDGLSPTVQANDPYGSNPGHSEYGFSKNSGGTSVAPTLPKPTQLGSVRNLNRRGRKDAHLKPQTNMTTNDTFPTWQQI